jgi:hypothetical protein
LEFYLQCIGNNIELILEQFWINANTAYQLSLSAWPFFFLSLSLLNRKQKFFSSIKLKTVLKTVLNKIFFTEKVRSNFLNFYLKTFYLKMVNNQLFFLKTNIKTYI